MHLPSCYQVIPHSVGAQDFKNSTLTRKISAASDHQHPFLKCAVQYYAPTAFRPLIQSCLQKLSDRNQQTLLGLEVHQLQPAITIIIVDH